MQGRRVYLAAAAVAAITMGAADTRAAGEDVAAKGAAVFEENCSACHQPGGTGQVGTAPSLVNDEFLSAASTRFLKATILQGREGTAMPPFDGVLAETDVAAVIAYLRSHAKAPLRGDALDREKPAKGDATKGAALFASTCSGCHGPRGEGYEAEGSGTAIGKPGFLATASDGFIRATVHKGRSTTPMHGFRGPEGLANLTVAEIEDVVSFLRTAPGK